MIDLINKLLGRPGGLIAGHNLGGKWNALSKRQRAAILRVLRGTCFDPLASGPPRKWKEGPKALLFSMSRWLEKDHLRPAAQALVANALNMPWEREPLIARHFALGDAAQFYYRSSDDSPEFLPLCVRACEEMIQIAPRVRRAMTKEAEKEGWPDDDPSHYGYARMHSLLRKSEPERAAKMLAAAEKGRWLCIL